MSLNTVKTTLGYIRSLIERRINLSLRDADLDAIYNYLNINDRISTSGQPEEKQFESIQQKGFSIIINLAPDDSANAICNEAETLVKLGIRYVHIPVDFSNPTQQDFDAFALVMQQHAQDKIWIHCAANMRVSAFLYRYRIEVLGEDEGMARQDLEEIWVPFGVWKEFTFRKE